jgi:hypothetical protein
MCEEFQRNCLCLSYRLYAPTLQSLSLTHNTGWCREPLPLVSSAVNQRSEPALNPESEPLHSSLVSEQRAVNHQRSEPGKGVLVQQFIREQMAQGTTPTLDEIMEACQCSRNTAIRHRRAILNETTQEERKPSHPVLVLAERRGK